MKTTDTHVYFWDGIYSNWDMCHFTYQDIEFANSEQAFMWCKAMAFADFTTAEKIKLETNPKKVKQLGREVKNFNTENWDTFRVLFMMAVNFAKFSQNPTYAQALKDTGNKILVEASPVDKIWGVGLDENNPLILDEKNWKGLNLLGVSLMEVRKQLFKNI